MSPRDSHDGLCAQGAPVILVRGVAHDYRNRLQTIFSALNLIKERVSSGRIADILSLANAAQDLLKGAGDLTNSVLSAACPPHWELERVEINGTLKALEPMLSGLCSGGIDFRIEQHDRDVPVMCSPRLLENAIINMVINADASIAGSGAITIAASTFDPVPLDGSDMHWPVAAITVSDTGCGMSEEALRRAFSPEYTTKAQSGGSGLGLMMTRLFADQAGGTVKIRSVSGEGTSIALLLPEALPIGFQAARRDAPDTAVFL